MQDKESKGISNNMYLLLILVVVIAVLGPLFPLTITFFLTGDGVDEAAQEQCPRVESISIADTGAAVEDVLVVAPDPGYYGLLARDVAGDSLAVLNVSEIMRAGEVYGAVVFVGKPDTLSMLRFNEPLRSAISSIINDIIIVFMTDCLNGRSNMLVSIGSMLSHPKAYPISRMPPGAQPGLAVYVDERITSGGMVAIASIPTPSGRTTGWIYVEDDLALADAIVVVIETLRLLSARIEMNSTMHLEPYALVGWIQGEGQATLSTLIIYYRVDAGGESLILSHTMHRLDGPWGNTAIVEYSTDWAPGNISWQKLLDWGPRPPKGADVYCTSDPVSFVVNAGLADSIRVRVDHGAETYCFTSHAGADSEGRHIIQHRVAMGLGPVVVASLSVAASNQGGAVYVEHEINGYGLGHAQVLVMVLPPSSPAPPIFFPGGR